MRNLLESCVPEQPCDSHQPHTLMSGLLCLPSRNPGATKKPTAMIICQCLTNFICTATKTVVENMTVATEKLNERR